MHDDGGDEGDDDGGDPVLPEQWKESVMAL